MKKVDSSGDSMRGNYVREDFPAGLARGKYGSEAASARNFVVLAPDLAALFPTSEAVNEALRELLLARKQGTR